MTSVEQQLLLMKCAVACSCCLTVAWFDQDEVVTGLEFINATSMKYKCCTMPRTFGQTFVPGDRLENLKVWEGYYCPETLDVSGRPEYQLDEYIGSDAAVGGTELWVRYQLMAYLIWHI